MITLFVLSSLKLMFDAYGLMGGFFKTKIVLHLRKQYEEVNLWIV